MSDDLQPDAIDDELRRRFDAGAPATADPDAVLDSMRPRLRQARTRRRASFASAIAGAAIVVVVLAFALGSGGGGTNSVHVPPASHGPVSTTTPTSPTPTTAPSGGSVTPDSVPGDHHGTDGTTGDPAPSAPDVTTPNEAPPTVPATSPAARDESYSSDGGSIVVHFENGQVSLASSSPAAGFTPEVHDNGPSRVEVRFTNGGTEWRIRVDVVNGELVPEITQHG